MCLMHLSGPGHLVSPLHPKDIVPGVLYVSSGVLISGCDTPDRFLPSMIQEDVVSTWQPAHSLVEDAVYEAEIAASPCLLALAVTHLPLCLREGTAPDGLLFFGIC